MLKLSLESYFLHLLRESFSTQKKYKYIGTCDKVRKNNCQNEAFWHEMMKNAKKIKLETFLKLVDLSEVVDPGDDELEWIKERFREDPDTNVYKSNWGSRKCVFLQVSGFEFIFVSEGV